MVFVFLFATVSAGDPYRPSAGARQAGMAYACVMNSDFWSSFHNQASLSYNKSFSLGFNYENRFNIKELGTRTVGMTIPVEKASIGALYSHFGYVNFKRQFAGLACGMRLSRKIYAGIQADYLSERTIGEYNHNQFLTCEAGLIIIPSETMKIGVHLFNPVPNSLRKICLPTSLRIGAGLNLNKGLFEGIEAEMSSGSKLIFKTGFEYEASEKLWLSGGFSTNNSSFSFGLGYKAKAALLDISFSTHEMLGVTSSMSVIIKINGN